MRWKLDDYGRSQTLSLGLGGAPSRPGERCGLVGGVVGRVVADLALDVLEKRLEPLFDGHPANSAGNFDSGFALGGNFDFDLCH